MVEAHVSITEQASGTRGKGLGVQSLELLGGHLQVVGHLWTWGDPWDVEAILATWKKKEGKGLKRQRGGERCIEGKKENRWKRQWNHPYGSSQDVHSTELPHIPPCAHLTLAVCHAVKEEPVLRAGPMANKCHVMAGLDAEDSIELHSLAGQRDWQRRQVGELWGQAQQPGVVGAPGPVTVHL